MDVDGFSQFGRDLFIGRRQEDAADARLRKSNRCSDHFTELSRQPCAVKKQQEASLPRTSGVFRNTQRPDRSLLKEGYRYSWRMPLIVSSEPFE
ncbi:MAG TPA: hypothetical protein VGJ30_05045 [Candidatus Angelobacter sp.]|jgi:hypothetical protein